MGDEENSGDKSLGSPKDQRGKEVGSARRRARQQSPEQTALTGTPSESASQESMSVTHVREQAQEAAKRKCHHDNVSDSSDGCQEENSNDSSGDDEPELAEEEASDGGNESDVAEQDNNRNDEDSEDSDELPVYFRPKPQEGKSQEEGSAVLQKPESKPRYNFMQDYLSYSQYTMKPSEFKRRRRGDLGLIQRLTLSHMLDGHQGCVNAIHFNESGSKLASGSDDKQIIVWDWQLKKKLLSFDSGHTSNVFQSKFLPFTGDTHIVTTSRDGQVRLAELSVTGTCRNSRRLAQHKGAAHKIALLSQRRHEFISGGEDGLIMALDVRQPKPNKLLTQKSENDITVSIYSVHASPVEDHLLVTAGDDKFVRLYDMRKMNNHLQKFCPRYLESGKRRLHVTCAVFSNDGQDIIGSYSDEDIFLFKTKDVEEKPEFVKRYQGHRNSHTVKGVNFYGSDSEYVVSGSDCGHIFFWDKEGEDIVHMIEGDVEGVVNCLEPHPNLPILATSGLDNEVKIWTPTSEEKVERADIRATVMENADPSKRMSTSSTFMGGQMLWQLVRHMQRTERRRRRQRRNPEEEGNVGESDTEDSSTSSDDDDDDDQEGPLQCAQC